MYLVDSNIWLERLLSQSKANEVEQFLKEIPLNFIHLSSFTVYPVGIILTKKKNHSDYSDFIDDLFLIGKATIQIPTELELVKICELSQNTGLDFDDSFQAFISQTRNLKLVSFDSDFSAKGIAVLSPLQAITDFQNTILKP